MDNLITCYRCGGAGEIYKYELNLEPILNAQDVKVMVLFLPILVINVLNVKEQVKFMNMLKKRDKE